MRSGILSRAAFAASLMRIATAQESVPQDLKAGFESSGKEVQVSYTNNAAEGFLDGASFSQDEVSKEPSFALGDSSGISSTTLYTIIMVDTTEDDTRTLHYARSNFKYNFDITNLETDSQPLLEYKAPGSFGETGDDRKYTFLMYTNPGRQEITDLKMPDEGKAFDVKQFQDDNGLEDAGAGVGMTVKLGGGGSTPPSDSPAESSAPAEAPSSAAEASSAPAQVTSGPTQASSAPAEASATAAESATSAAVSSAAGATSEASAAPSATPTDSSDSEAESSAASAGATGGRTSDLAAASSALETGAAVPSTLQVSPTSSNATASSTTGLPAESTGLAASISLGRAHYTMIASLLAFAALLAL